MSSNYLRLPIRALCCLLPLLATACGDAADADPGAEAVGDERPVRGGTAVIADLADVNTVSPIFYGSALDSDVADMLYMQLLRPDWDEGTLRYRTADESPMALAERYEFVGDSTALRFHLRSDARWSDGEPITAEDVAFTYDLIADPATAAPRASEAEHVDSVVVHNDSTLTFHFDQVYATMLSDVTHPVVPEHVYGDVPRGALRTHASFSDPVEHQLVVSGPFRVASWQRGQQIVFERNPQFEPAANLDRLVIRTVPDPTTRLVEMRTGETDVARALSFEQAAELRAQAGARLELLDDRLYEYIGWNPRGFEAFEEPDVRRALGLAIDVEGIRQALGMEEFTTAAGGPYPPLFEELYDAEVMRPVGYDPAQARRLLEQQGWTDTDGDGIREKDGRPFRFTLMTNAGNQRRADVSQIVQQQLRQVGVDVRLETVEFNTLFQRLLEKDYEAVLSGWQVDLSGDLHGLWGKDQTYNVVGYDNPRFDELAQQGMRQPTLQAAAPYWRQAAAQLVADQPVTFLYFYDGVETVNPRLRGMEVDAFGMMNNPWAWWIPADQQRRPAAAQTTDAQPADAPPPATS